MNAEAFIWNEIEETLIREYGMSRGIKIANYARRACQGRVTMTQAVERATEWERRLRAEV